MSVLDAVLSTLSALSSEPKWAAYAPVCLLATVHEEVMSPATDGLFAIVDAHSGSASDEGPGG